MKNKKYFYICSMKKSCFLVFALLLLSVSCEKERRAFLLTLDDTIERKADFDIVHEHLQDSLRSVLSAATTDSARWEASYNLEKIFFYHDVDSCYGYIRKMLQLQGKDPRRRGISGACYANILYKMDSLSRALSVLEKTDTSALRGTDFRTYGFAGYHIYRKLMPEDQSYSQKYRELTDKWWRGDSTNVECTYYHIERMRLDSLPVAGIGLLEKCTLSSPNDTAKFYYFLAKEHLNDANQAKAMECFATSAIYDLRVSAKAYNALYELARILFRRGDIRRADRYMRMTLEDAYSSHYALRYNDIIASEFEIMNVLRKEDEQKKWTYLITTLSVALMLLVAVVLLFRLAKYSSWLSTSRSKLNEVSNIKDSFLANYMEKCVDYLNKVDEYRSSLRHTLKQDGPDAVRAMLRKPSFAGGEFNELLTSLDSTFLGIFPDFVDKVNEHMQEGYKLEQSTKGTMSTELRILALIKMGISKRQKIAKILNMSVTTVYSYHCNLQKHSIHPDANFDRVIASL